MKQPVELWGEIVQVTEADFFVPLEAQLRADERAKRRILKGRTKITKVGELRSANGRQGGGVMEMGKEKAFSWAQARVNQPACLS